MARPLSVDLKLRVAAAVAVGETVRGAVNRFRVSVATAVRIGQRDRSGRGLEPGKIGDGLHGGRVQLAQSAGHFQSPFSSPSRFSMG